MIFNLMWTNEDLVSDSHALISQCNICRCYNYAMTGGIGGEEDESAALALAPACYNYIGTYRGSRTIVNSQGTQEEN